MTRLGIVDALLRAAGTPRAGNDWCRSSGLSAITARTCSSGGDRVAGARVEIGEHLAQVDRLRHALERALDHRDRFVGASLLLQGRGQQRRGVLVAGRDLERACAHRSLPRFDVCLSWMRAAAREVEQIRIVGMRDDGRLDELERTLGRASEYEHARKIGTRLHVVRIGIDRRLVHAGRVAQVADALERLAVHEACVGVVGLDLQRVAEFDARLLEIAVDEIFLAARHVAFLARLRAAAGGERQARRPRKPRVV